LVRASVLISAGNAVSRKAFNLSSNAFLEIQWYLFAAVFMLAAGYTLMRQEHVKIDVVSGRFSKRTQIKIEIIGLCLFLLPFVYYVTKLSMPLVINAYVTQEMSSNAGGLIRWPVFAMLPLGLLLLGIQAVSELIKRIAFLQGLIPDPSKKQGAKTPEEEFAEFLLEKEVAARDAALLGAQK
jgi:TRAP-type mannitol/chloroaromatic compound transport system permease small subunit